jgi:glycine betaine/proline transport system permease protein
MAGTSGAQTTKSETPSLTQSSANGAKAAPDSTLEAPAVSFVEGLPRPLRAVLTLPKWILFIGLALLAGSLLPLAPVLVDVPEAILVGSPISKAVDKGVDWIVVTGDPLFSAINIVLLRYLLVPLEKWLQLLPWWVVVVVVVLISYRMVGRRFAIMATGMMLALGFLNLWDQAMSTLALVMVATLLAVVLGVPAGIFSARWDRFDALQRPVLDMMQTMPSFVYLIPVLMLFGLGKVPAVVATLIYAVPPIIRLTNLGIRQVDSSVLEAARAFGSTTGQLLFKVQIPLALPTVMAGLNQTIMMSLAMVVIASMIGAKGLGVEVLNGIARLDVGRGLIGGVGIVIMAIILDRITQGFARSRQPIKSAE